MMSDTHNAQVLRIYMKESYQYNKMPVYEYLIYEAREREMSGATLMKAPLGFGQEERDEGLRYKLSSETPVVLEIVETAEKVAEFLPIVQEALNGQGLIIQFGASIR